MLIVFKWSWISISCDSPSSTHRRTQIWLCFLGWTNEKSFYVAIIAQSMKIIWNYCGRCALMTYSWGRCFPWRGPSQVININLFPSLLPPSGYVEVTVAVWGGSYRAGWIPVVCAGVHCCWRQSCFYFKLNIYMSCQWQPTSECMCSESYAAVCAVRTKRRFAQWDLSDGLRNEN
jgi:hypothetical protein